ncbi:two-component sensor histidine kinase [Nonlabens spongiae]|uniref:histidine kinase n=1 Tax=Nonlabens spongiae TaxID=331648 RepID=A0A1W6MKW3_9FLAO|nr:HAMP domain-containing sensor histidine kinase [Nonlabens spongiae]ARN78217.1 two-component sensor histidine kinase [Nonlabens spongiae]
MKFADNKSLWRWAIILGGLAITMLILWNTYIFFNKLKETERKNVEEFVTAQKDIINSGIDEDQNLGDLPLEVLGNTTNVPIILVNNVGEIETRNIPDHIANDSLRVQELIKEFASENEPIEFSLDGEVFTTTYHGNSSLITKLKYYPLALVLILFLFGAVIYFFYRSTKSSEQNKLWAGMAKESAHQIGTPLSSLVGWTVILRDSDVDPTYVNEMEKDIKRLQTITDRFSKIGSTPDLIKTDIVAQTLESTDYISSRSSKMVEFNIDVPDQPIEVHLNPQLYAWVIENLIKNGIDAMKGKGQIDVFLKADVHNVYLRISDTGKGIPKKLWKEIFRPGFTTKKRGWGLGLSLAKRIIEDYHSGKIRVLESKKDQGTTFELMIKKA